MPIITNLDVMLAKRKMTLTQLSKAIGISLTNLSLLKTGNVKGLRYNTLEKICIVLDCQPGDILEYRPDEDEDEDSK
ncbi:MAG: helix-turn-helix transcriptional regulator [Candidatus Marinimicrobia bacterium]|nr:helix-turn-helix transcriptional regulator [Candidatus Neomarinimicrobiota bacterium]